MRNYTKQDIIRIVEENDVQFIRLQFTDVFGTLKNVLTSNFRKNSDNMIISYDTPNGQYKFKIFSGYRVEYTTDYLKTDFESKKEC